MARPEITYRKAYLHEFDSIGEWWVFRWAKPTGVSYPWGTLGQVSPVWNFPRPKQAGS